ncbi:MAG: hypothetical protein HC798_03975 [Polaribacter sp.]|nr:hypothetical protein [Polaribacter sp.]
MSTEINDELLRLLEEEESKSSSPSLKSKENSSVMFFIKKFNVTPGDFKVPTYVIYFHYRTWRMSIGKKSSGKEEFFRTFKKHFKQKRSGNQRFYMINNSLDISPELKVKAKHYDQTYKKSIKKKKQKG